MFASDLIAIEGPYGREIGFQHGSRPKPGQSLRQTTLRDPVARLVLRWMKPKPLEELDYRKTDLGELILRRRIVPSLDDLEVYEVILGDAFLMSSMFTEVEVALSDLGLAAAEAEFPGERLDAVVGGLGLGYTAQAALRHDSVGELYIVEYLEPVIEWHQKGLVPLGTGISSDSRTHYVLGDYFQLAVSEKPAASFCPEDPEKRFHAVLLDIDHSPDNLLHERNAAYYKPAGLRKFAEKLHPGGIFALWSDDAPETGFMDALSAVFETCESHVVSFYNPLQERTSASTVYVAQKRKEG